MLHALVLRSPHAHARIRSIDVSAARNLAGVAAVLTGDDVQGIIKDIPTRTTSGESQVVELNAPEQPALAMGKVNYAGQPVAIVAADDRYLAQDTMELIQVDYEPLKPDRFPEATAGKAHRTTDRALGQCPSPSR